MSGNASEQDNSIEEILASIRQIISEDDPKAGQPAAAAPVAPPPAPPPPMPEPEPEPITADDVFELVDRVVAEEESLPEPAPAPVVPVPEPEPITIELRDNVEEPAPYVPPPASPVAVDETSVFTDTAASATLGAFSKLSETIVIERQKAVTGSIVTLEDIVKDLLSPLLRQWIDQHVPGIVERLVREELEKLARQAREG